ncbi:MAG: IS200/IS605 family transposase [Bacteroidales bacterium]
MANTYTQLNVHAVFSVKGRGNFLSSSVRSELYPFISGILKKSGNFPLAINGYKDHVHAFFEINPANSVSDVLKEIKSNSSRWINDQRFMPGKFNWQTGFGAFSYSRSQRNSVIQYIVNQEQHHHVSTFREEYLKLLEKFEIDYNLHFTFEFYD